MNPTSVLRIGRATLVLALLFASATSLWADSFDHSLFDALLKKHVKDGLVNYDGFKAAPEFRTYLASLDRVRVEKLDANERLAFWINAYNAFTIELINKYNERQSIRNINKTLGLSLKGPWREPIVLVGGIKRHLDNVEHDIIRKQWKEPRIHFALVCAAIGCPPLRSEAYTGASLDAQLDDQARAFLLRSPQKNRVDVVKRIVYGSPIYTSYYREDFGSADAAIGRYLSRFFPSGPEKELLLSGRFQLVSTDYDWTLNRQLRSTLPRTP